MPTLPQLIEEDVREFQRALEDLLVKSEASVAVLIDKGGFLLTECGQTQQFDLTTMAALSAASFAATQGIATLVQEANFSSVYQQGETHSILVVNVDEYCLLTVIFQATISVGAVKYFAANTIKQVARQLRRAHKRSPGMGLDLSELNLADAGPLFRRKTA